MVVAIEKDLNDLKGALSKRGFEVVDLETYQYPIDAIVYEGNAFQISHISRNNMPDSSIDIGGSTMLSRPSYGVFMINASGKSIEEIEDMLKHRYYSPLF